MSENAKDTGLSDVVNALASVNIDKKISELQSLFETQDDSEALDYFESDKTLENQAAVTGGYGNDNNVKKKDKKKKKKKTGIEKVAEYLDDTFKDVLFFENIISRIDDTIRTALLPVYSFNELLIYHQQVLAQENMKLATEYFKLAVSTIGLAASAEVLAASNMTLASSQLSLAASTFTLAISVLADAAAILVDAVMNVIMAAINVVFAVVYFTILSVFAVTVVLVTAIIIAVLAIATVAIIAALVVATAIIIAAIAALTVTFLLAIAIAAVMLVVFTAVLVTALIVAAVIAAAAIIAVAAIAAVIVIVTAAVMAAVIAVLAVILAAAIMAVAVAIAALGYGVLIAMQVIASTALGVMVSMMAASVSFLGSMALAFVIYTSTLFLTAIAYGAVGIVAAIGTVAALVNTVSLTILLITLLLAFSLNKLFKDIHGAIAKWWEESPLRQLVDKIKDWWMHSSIRRWIYDKLNAIKNQKPDKHVKTSLWDIIRNFLANNKYVQRVREFLEAMKSADSLWDFLKEKFPIEEWMRNGIQYLYYEYIPAGLRSVLEWWKKTKKSVTEALDWVAEKFRKFTDWCVDIGNQIIDGLSNAYNKLVDWTSEKITAAMEAINKAWEYCKAVVRMLWDKAVAYATNIAKNGMSYCATALYHIGEVFTTGAADKWLKEQREDQAKDREFRSYWLERTLE